jgi:hypothetical protein
VLRVVTDGTTHFLTERGIDHFVVISADQVACHRFGRVSWPGQAMVGTLQNHRSYCDFKIPIPFVGTSRLRDHGVRRRLH